VFIVLAICVARWEGRRRGLANLLAFSGLAILALRTSWIGNVGVQLSFLAVATIAVFAQGRSGGRGERADALAAVIEESWSWRERFGHWLAHWTWQMARLSFWVWLMTAPLIWMNFHVLSFVAIPLNIVLWPFLVVGLLSGLGVAITWWFPPLASVLGCICGASLWMIGGIVWLGDRLTLGHLWLPAPPRWWMIAFYASAAIGVIAIQFRPRWRVGLGALLCGWLMIGAAPWMVGARGHGPAWLRNLAGTVASGHIALDRQAELRMTFIDVGHGTSVMLELPNREVWLYDAGHLGSPERSHQEIASALWSVPTARIDRLFISHADADHYNAIPGLVERFSIGQAEAPPQFWQHLAPELGALREVVQRHRIPTYPLAQGDRFLSGQVDVEVLHPPANWSDVADNGNSLTLLVRYAGRACLLPGDLEKAGLKRLLDQPEHHCDVLMAPHHGSLAHDPQPAFRWCRPEWIVISGGPRAVRPEVVARYTTPASRTAITHRDGAIQLRIADDGGLTMWHWVESRWEEL
jgi:competence protein ComEC